MTHAHTTGDPFNKCVSDALKCNYNGLIRSSHLAGFHLPSATSIWYSVPLNRLSLTLPQVTSSLSRVQEDITDPKYTLEHVLEQKIGPVPGWKELLKSIGFHFIGQISRDVPSTIIFPEHDDSNMLQKCKKSINTLLSE